MKMISQIVLPIYPRFLNIYVVLIPLGEISMIHHLCHPRTLRVKTFALTQCLAREGIVLEFRLVWFFYIISSVPTEFVDLNYK